MKNKLMFLFLGIFLISFGSAWSEDEFNNSLSTENMGFSENINTTDLVSYYKLDESSGTILDAHGSNDGTYNGALYSQTGKINTAIGFDGSDDYIDLPDKNFYGGFSVSMWVKVDSTATSQTFISNDINNNAPRGVQMSVLAGGTVRIYDGSSVTATTDTITAGTYYFLTWTHSGSTAKIYINGVEKASASSSIAADVLKNLVIGSRGGTTTFFNGDLDEVGIWNRALTSSEIKQLYNSSNGLAYPLINDLTRWLSVPEGTLLTNAVLNLSGWGYECYQESANTSNQIGIDGNCGLIYNGSYDYSDGGGFYGGGGDRTLLVDGDWDTYTYNQRLRINYTKPLFSNKYSKWKIKDFYVSGDKIANLIINESCWNAYNDKIVLKTITTGSGLNFYSSFQCYNSTNWITMASYYSGEEFNQLFEESMLWEIYPSSPSLQINNTKVWNHTGEFNTSAQTSNFAQTINDYIDTATAVAGYYLIPFIFHSDTTGILEYLNLIFNNDGFTENSQTYSSETTEGNIETFEIDFDYDSNEYSTVEAKLIYNNTEYTGTKTSGTGNTVVYSADAIVPQISTDENKTFYWNILVGTTYQNSTSNNQTVYELSIDDCSAHSVLILNMSLKDEELAILVNGSNGANVEIDLILTVPGNPDATQYYYKKWTDENNPQVCITTDELNYTIDYTIGFDSTDRVWEFLYLDGGILDSTKIFDDYTNYNINLMDLKTTDSTSFLFNYFDVDGLAVDGSMVHVFRKYIGQGEFLEVERSKADQNGDTVVHLVEEDVIYYFVITNNGETLYTTSTNTILCQAVPCTIEIEASGVSAEFDTDWDLVDGGAFSISSNTNTKTVSLTYSKNISAIWEMDLYKYEDDGSFTLLNSTTATGTSGTTSLSVPLSAGNVSFFVTVSVDDVYIKSEWVDFEDNTNDVFGTTLSLFLAGLIILSLGLMAISEGAGVLIWVMLGVFLSGALGLLTTSLSTGISIVTYLIVAGALLVWKIAGGRK